MHVSNIDKLVIDVIDDFYLNVISKSTFVKKMLGETNFIKFQKEINDQLADYIKDLPMNIIDSIAKKGTSRKYIINLIKRYIAIYTFAYIAFFYKSEEGVYINNLVEFNKNQSNYYFKVENFFNAESNSLIIEIYHIIKNIQVIIENKGIIRSTLIERNDDAKKTLQFLTSRGEEFIKTNFLVENVLDQAHYVIKTFMIDEIYEIRDKMSLYKLVELSESSNEDYIYIDIVVPTSNVLDFSAIENMMSRHDHLLGVAHDFWNMLTVNYEEPTPYEKINSLISNKVVMPITADFLAYHKDGEKYDKSNSTIKKKEDTKIKFIIDKLDSISELFSESVTKNVSLKSEIIKNFYLPLSNRNAVIVNHFEEIKMINKFTNLNKKNQELIDDFNDLAGYKNYPYICFKDFESWGVSIIPEKTVDAVRSVSITSPKGSILQYRIGSDNVQLNIVGLFVPTTTKHFMCLKTDEIIDIRSITKSQNGFELFSDFLKKSLIHRQPHKSSVYWLFDLEKDKFKLNHYELTSANSKTDQTKLMLATLYDNIKTKIKDHVIETINKSKNMTYLKMNEIMNSIQANIPFIFAGYDIHNISKIYADIETYFLKNKIIIDNDTYDRSEEQLSGLVGDVFNKIKNPFVKPPQVEKIIVTDVKTINPGQLLETEGMIESICQHIIKWNDIMEIKKTDAKKFVEEMFKFNQQYAVEDYHGDFVCRSCGIVLDLQQYKEDGVFDDSSQKFVTFSTPMNVPLESITEYVPYADAIQKMDKIIEKVASLLSLAAMQGNAIGPKNKRKNVTKKFIDIILLNTTYFRYKFKERNESTAKIYGISRNLSNLYMFDFNNSVFQFSSKDKDVYKDIKMNNIYTYTLILTIIEMNDSQIYSIQTDKKNYCDFETYSKISAPLFGSLKLLRNDKGDVDDMLKYPILCYVIYVISCKMIRYKMWNHQDLKNNDKNLTMVQRSVIQKTIIHTIVDMINSILENSFKNKSAYELEIFRVMFYNKLNKVYNNRELYKKIHDRERGIGAKKIQTVVSNKRELIPINSIDYKNTKTNIIQLPVCKYKRISPTITHTLFSHFPNPTLATNCADGKFHKYSSDGTTLKCGKCGYLLSDFSKHIISSSTNFNTEIYEYDDDAKKQHNEIITNLLNTRLNALAEIICLDGFLHTFEVDQKLSKKVCSKCNKQEKHKYSQDELLEISKNFNLNKQKKHDESIRQSTISEKNTSEDILYISKATSKNKTSYDNSIKESKYNFIENFVKLIENIVGNNKSVLGNSHLVDNIYTIDHDHNGVQLQQPIIILDSDQKILFKENHPHFKTDVLYYTNNKYGKIDVFYDATTKILLGYKEESKQIVSNVKIDKTIKVNYSLFEKIKLMGYRSKYINLEDVYDEMYVDERESFVSKDKKLKKIPKMIRQVIFDRQHNLKRVAMYFNRLFYKILNNFPKDLTLESKDAPKILEQSKDENVNKEIKELKMFYQANSNHFAKQIDKISSVFYGKFSEIQISEPNGNHKIFKHWKAVCDGTNAKEFSFVDKSAKLFKSMIVDADDISHIDSSGNSLLFYIVTELSNLIQYNSKENKALQINIVTFLVSFINSMFDIFNDERIMNNRDIRAFLSKLRSDSFDQTFSVQTMGIYDEVIDPLAEISEEDKNKQDDAKEENEALDMEVDNDDYNWDPTTDGAYNVEFNYDRLTEFE